MLPFIPTAKANKLDSNPQFRRIAEFLDRDGFDGFTGKDLFIKQIIKKGWGQDIAALSNMSEALDLLTNELDSARRLDLLEKVIVRAIHPKVNPWKKPIEKVKNFGHFGYYLEHLNICLGLYHRAGGQAYVQLARDVSEHLVQASLSQSNAHARLLPHVKMRWAADQAAILYSLWIHDQNHGTDLHAEPARRWCAYMREHGTHRPTGMFITEVMGSHRYSNQPRGCSHSYMVHYMSSWAPELAAEQWALFKEHMLIKRFGSWGFREYLPSFAGRMTPDTGPIIRGVGIAATGLALKVSATLDKTHDPRRASMMKSAKRWNLTLRMMNQIPLVNIATRIGTDLLASSIILTGELNRSASSGNQHVGTTPTTTPSHAPHLDSN